MYSNTLKTENGRLAQKIPGGSSGNCPEIAPAPFSSSTGARALPTAAAAEEASGSAYSNSHLCSNTSRIPLAALGESITGISGSCGCEEMDVCGSGGGWANAAVASAAAKQQWMFSSNHASWSDEPEAIAESEAIAVSEIPDVNIMQWTVAEEDSSHLEVSLESEMTEAECERAVHEQSVSDASNDSFTSRGLVAATLIVMECDRASVTSGEESSQLTSSNDLLQDRLSHLRIVVVHDRHWLAIYQGLKQVEFRSSRLTVELVPRGKLLGKFPGIHLLFSRGSIARRNGETTLLLSEVKEVLALSCEDACNRFSREARDCNLLKLAASWKGSIVLCFVLGSTRLAPEILNLAQGNLGMLAQFSQADGTPRFCHIEDVGKTVSICLRSLKHGGRIVQRRLEASWPPTTDHSSPAYCAGFARRLRDEDKGRCLGHPAILDVDIHL